MAEIATIASNITTTATTTAIEATYTGAQPLNLRRLMIKRLPALSCEGARTGLSRFMILADLRLIPISADEWQKWPRLNVGGIVALVRRPLGACRDSDRLAWPGAVGLFNRSSFVQVSLRFSATERRSASSSGHGWQGHARGRDESCSGNADER